MSRREDDRRVLSVIESGVIVGRIDRALSRIWRGAGDSVAVSAATRWVAAWRGLGRSTQRFAAGLTLVVAVATHLLLAIATETPAGWLWLILPGLALAIGGLLLLASSDVGTSVGRR